MATPFDADAGSGQGRIIPTTGAPFEGAYVYQLGHDQAGVVRTLNAFDFHKIAQSDPLAGVKVLRAKVRLRPPKTLPAGATWLFQMLVDGAPALNLALDGPGPALAYTDLAASVGNLFAGMHEVAFQLTLLGAQGQTYDVELPGVALDDVIEDLGDQNPGVGNRVPEPGAIGVSLSLGFSFDLFATGASPPDLGRTTIFVGGVVAYAAGVFAPGWSLQSSSQVGQGTVRFQLVPDVPFPSQATITVHVVSAVQGGPANSLDQTWSFTTLDTTPPNVLSAAALDGLHVRVTFSEPVLEQDADAAADALHPGNYTLALVAGAPAVTPEVVEVKPGATSDSAVLVLGEPLTHGATYRVTVESVVDLSNNAITPPANVAEFLAATLPDVPGREASLLRRVPEINRALDAARAQHLRKFLACLEVIYRELLSDVDAWTDILDPDVAPESFVDAMLEDLGNPFPFVLDLVDKRRTVRLLIALYQQKGTDDGMINAIRLFAGVEVTIAVPAADGVWILGDSNLGDDTVLGSGNVRDLYSFDVVSPVALTDEQRQRIRAVVAFLRRAPTHLRWMVEPGPPPGQPDHVELALSELSTQWLLH